MSTIHVVDRSKCSFYHQIWCIPWQARTAVVEWRCSHRESPQEAWQKKNKTEKQLEERSATMLGYRINQQEWEYHGGLKAKVWCGYQRNWWLIMIYHHFRGTNGMNLGSTHHSDILKWFPTLIFVCPSSLELSHTSWFRNAHHAVQWYIQANCPLGFTTITIHNYGILSSFF